MTGHVYCRRDINIEAHCFHHVDNRRQVYVHWHNVDIICIL